MDYPLVTHAQVLAVNPVRGTVKVWMTSLHIPLDCRVLRFGAADGVRVNQEALPVPGTWGIVLFPYGDERNGIWIGSYYTQLQDALTGDDDPATQYSAHWSGQWDLLDGHGNYTSSFPDGTYFRVGSGTAAPVPTRHIVNPDQTVSTVPYPASARVPNPPGAFDVFVRHVSGTTIRIDPSGNVTITGAP